MGEKCKHAEKSCNYKLRNILQNTWSGPFKYASVMEQARDTIYLKGH